MTVSPGVVAICAAQACAQIGAFSVVVGAVAFVWLGPADLAGDRAVARTGSAVGA
jgi:hypothetical protein